MELPWIRIVSQSGVYLTFAVYLAWAARRGARAWAPVLGAVVYAVLFEHWNMLRYAHVQGGYHYHSASWFWVLGDVPLYIPLAWAFILATSRSLTDHLRLQWWARPFADALFALLIDLSMDAVAIRLHFWTWHGVALDQAFFGVPADNFVGWLLVSFTFSALTRWVWSDERARWVRTGIQVAVVPPAAYLVYLGIESIVHLAYVVFHADSLQRQLWVLAGTVALFAIVVVAGLRGRRTELVGDDRDGAGFAPVRSSVSPMAVHGPRHIFHLFGLIGLLFVPTAGRNGALWWLAGSVWCAEWMLAVFASKRGSAGAEPDVERI